MKFFSYICNCVALDTGMCVVEYTHGELLISDIVTTFVVRGCRLILL